MCCILYVCVGMLPPYVSSRVLLCVRRCFYSCVHRCASLCAHRCVLLCVAVHPLSEFLYCISPRGQRSKTDCWCLAADVLRLCIHANTRACLSLLTFALFLLPFLLVTCSHLLRHVAFFLIILQIICSYLLCRVHLFRTVAPVTCASGSHVADPLSSAWLPGVGQGKLGKEWDVTTGRDYVNEGLCPKDLIESKSTARRFFLKRLPCWWTCRCSSLYRTRILEWFCDVHSHKHP